MRKQEWSLKKKMFLVTFAEKVQAVIPCSASSAIDGCIRAVAVLEAAERG